MCDSIYLSQNCSDNSLSDLQFSATDINALSPIFIQTTKHISVLDFKRCM
jgi:hypothetical protein